MGHFLLWDIHSVCDKLYSWGGGTVGCTWIFLAFLTEFNLVEKDCYIYIYSDKELERRAEPSRSTKNQRQDLLYSRARDPPGFKKLFFVQSDLIDSSSIIGVLGG